MDIIFQQLQEKDFTEVHDLILNGWYFSYLHIQKKELKKLVDKYYSDIQLKRLLDSSKKGNVFFELAFEENKLIGVCGIEIKDKAELITLYVLPQKHRHGVGSNLLSHAEDFLRKKGINFYSTFVNKHNLIGLSFYKKKGFKRNSKEDKSDEFEEESLFCVEKKF